MCTADDYAAYARGMAAFLAGAATVLGASHPLLTGSHAALSSDIGAPLPAFAGEPDPDLARRIGWEYVVSGSTLGAQLLLRDVRRRGYHRDVDNCFLSGFSESEAWPGFLRGLQQVQLDGAASLRACSAALEAFHCAEQALVEHRISA